MDIRWWHCSGCNKIHGPWKHKNEEFFYMDWRTWPPDIRYGYFCDESYVAYKLYESLNPGTR